MDWLENRRPPPLILPTVDWFENRRPPPLILPTVDHEQFPLDGPSPAAAAFDFSGFPNFVELRDTIDSIIDTLHDDMQLVVTYDREQDPPWWETKTFRRLPSGETVYQTAMELFTIDGWTIGSILPVVEDWIEHGIDADITGFGLKPATVAPSGTVVTADGVVLFDTGADCARGLTIRERAHLAACALTPEMAKRRDFLLKLYENCPPGGKIPAKLASTLEIKLAPEHHGMGVFAKQPVARDTLLGVYTGEVCHGQREARLTEEELEYAMGISLPNGETHGTILANNSAVSGWLRTLNAPNKGERANVGAVPEQLPGSMEWIVVMYARRDIAAGEQLLFMYKLLKH
jgi:hypothetical protein